MDLPTLLYLFMLLRTLGGVRVDGSSFGRRKPLLLLAYLALEGAKDRRYLSELFWPNAANPRQSLTVAVSQLRQGVANAVASDSTRLWTTVRCDALQLREAVAAHAWREASELYAGRFMAGVDVDDGNVELEEWLVGMRERLAAQATRASVELADDALAAGSLRLAAKHVDKALAAWSDSATMDLDLLRRLHALTVATGDPVAADIRNEAQQLGLKLPLPEAIATPEPPGADRQALPSEQAVFVGRQDELLELQQLLAEGAKLVTITGLGGMGKTSLALALAHRLRTENAYQQVYFVPFETVPDVNGIIEHLSVTLLSDQATGDPFAAVIGRIRAGRTLLVLDGFEHLIAGAHIVGELMRVCPDSRVLVTSREPLALAHETLFPLSGLALPVESEGALMQPESSAGLRLYHLTVRRFDPHFQLNEQDARVALGLCNLVAGSPLGIELAAALSRSVAPTELLKLLADDLDTLVSTSPEQSGRHASLRAVFQRSWDLLPTSERTALAACSVFHGSFDLAAALSVASLDLKRLTALIDRSLVRRNGHRYDLHPLIGQYAREKLAEDQAEAGRVHAEHAAYFTDVVGAMRRSDMKPGHDRAFDELEYDYANVRAAWGWAATQGRTDLIFRMAPMLTRFLYDRRPVNESAALMDLALAHTESESEVEAALLWAKGYLLARTDAHLAQLLCERSAAMALALGSTAQFAKSTYTLGLAHVYQQAHMRARQAISRALEILKHDDPDGLLGGCYANLGVLTENPEEHERLLSLGADACRRVHNVFHLPIILHNLSVLLQSAYGDWSGALKLSLEALALEYRESRRPYFLELFHDGAAQSLVALGDLTGAEEHVKKVRRLQVGRRPWEDHKYQGYPQNDRTWFLLLYAQGELQRARVVGTRMPDSTDVCEALAWAALAEGSASGVHTWLPRMDEAATRAFSARGREELRASSLLLRAGVTALEDDPRAADPSGTGHSDAPEGGENMRQLATALTIIIDLQFVPLAFDALLVAHLVAPSAVGKDVLALVARQPSAHGHTRRWATSLLQRYPSTAGVSMQGVAVSAAPSQEGLSPAAIKDIAGELLSRLPAAALSAR